MSESFEPIQAKIEDLDEIIDYLYSDFFKNDPLSIMKVPREMSEPTTRSVVTKGINAGFAYYLRNENGEIVALRSATIRTRDEPTYIKTDKADDKKHPFMEFNRKLFEKISLWDILPSDVNRILWISLISVRLDYTRQGLAKKLVTFDREEWKRQGLQAVCAIAAAIKSQKLFVEQLGFKVEAQLLHTEILSDTTGEQIVKCVDGTDRHQLVRLIL
ncbi:unnamed protein product, partial [Mesorhabditis belari]|uniref:N-acetyltransferase domain-containing protein n=1 Tax=Mesorhabditis belari TaxID=2138241 RepID=A0AAF3EGG6_9BILA